MNSAGVNRRNQLWAEQIGALPIRDLAYLAGIIDGEGCVTLAHKPCYNPKAINALCADALGA